MPINRHSRVAAFLLPHQDDEFGAFGLVEDCVAKAERPVCIFLTDGQANAAVGARRNRESQAVLRQLGVAQEDIFFLGTELRVPDGMLYQHLEQVYHALIRLLGGLNIAQAYVPAWEGGHHDHDAAHALGVLLCETLSQKTPLQFPLYNGVGLPGPLFRVLHPLPTNGEVQRVRFGLRRACRYLALCLCYRSQWRTWLGLYPFIALVTLSRRGYALQQVNLRRMTERPHSGPLFYERRFGVDYADVSAAIATFMGMISVVSAGSAACPVTDPRERPAMLH